MAKLRWRCRSNKDRKSLRITGSVALISFRVSNERNDWRAAQIGGTAMKRHLALWYCLAIPCLPALGCGGRVEDAADIVRRTYGWLNLAVSCCGVLTADAAVPMRCKGSKSEGYRPYMTAGVQGGDTAYGWSNQSGKIRNPCKVQHSDARDQLRNPVSARV